MANSNINWFEINNIEGIDSPALLIYPDRVSKNIDRMIQIAGGTDKLRPHVKTYKMAEIARMQLEAGINKFKCATISEAEMLCQAGASDVLLAYQPVGPKIGRLFQLVAKFPNVQFAALIDNEKIASDISIKFSDANKSLNVYIDIDTGNHRTGIKPELVFDLYKYCKSLPGARVVGLHAYDGHIRNSDFNERKIVCDKAFEAAEMVRNQIQEFDGQELSIIAGGTPTFPCHALRKEYVICSPGTCLLWDWGYNTILPDLDFDYAALVLTRIISKIGDNRICLDLGHKAIASENPFPRVNFLNLENAPQVGHSEEHLVLDVGNNSKFNVGDTFYGVPLHICPTTALYAEANIARNNQVSETWKVVARDRAITI